MKAALFQNDAANFCRDRCDGRRNPHARPRVALQFLPRSKQVREQDMLDPGRIIGDERAHNYPLAVRPEIDARGYSLDGFKAFPFSGWGRICAWVISASDR